MLIMLQTLVPSGNLLTGFIMGNEFEKQDSDIISNFLELLGSDDLIGFKSSTEEECHDIDEASLWYKRRIGSKMMGFKEKTTLMIATMFESKGVLNYILETSFVDVNQASGLDRLLHFILFLLWTLLYKPPLAMTRSYMNKSGIKV
ncbi:hypothetical protein CMV_002779 [Castanea mollissima]|uniref:Uncharacterized protein n=1 Tax=Castanea mollissima TaxID=60419 RepID=A0A8J4W5Q0_9ROSI|nr:hypothetical protein CMV_002779 [Castanea mollissima]